MTTILKKPPDKNKIITVKCNINKIVRNNNFISPLFDVCFRTNKIVIQTYQFLRLWILEHYHNNIDIPIITTDTIKMVFSVLTQCCKLKIFINIIVNLNKNILYIV